MRKCPFTCARPAELSLYSLLDERGIPPFKDWRPAADAVIVARMKAAGAIVLGKTNVPFALADWQSYNDI